MYKLHLKIGLLSLLFFLMSSTAQAANYTIANGDVRGLIDAILAASRNNDPDVIVLATNGLYEVTSAYANADDYGHFEGGIAFPEMWGNITIRGNGATIRRASNAVGLFRFFFLRNGVELTVDNLTFRDARNDHSGGALFLGFSSKCSFTNVKFINNTTTAGFGGAIYGKTFNRTTIENCEFVNNKTSEIGGAIYQVLSDISINNSLFTDNSCTNPVAIEGGGAVYLDGARGDTGNMRITNSTFLRNTSFAQGGAVGIFLYNGNTGVVDNCEFADNICNASTKTGVGFGGGLNFGEGKATDFLGLYTTAYPVSTKLDISNCTFFNNTAYNQGGGLWLAGATITITNTTIASNKLTAGNGGGVKILGRRANVTFNNCTISENFVNDGIGGGIDNDGGRVLFRNTIFDRNGYNIPNNPNFGRAWYSQYRESGGGTAVDLGNNIQYLSWTNVGSMLPSTIRIANPMLSPIANNGGRTRTLALQAGSAAIDAGSGCAAADQRGLPRVGTCDIGAFEYNANVTPPPPPPAPVANFTPATIQNINVGQNVTFTNTSTNNPTSFQWAITGGTVMFINGTSATSANPQVRFDAAGSYTVALTATNAGGNNTKTIANLVNVTAVTPPVTPPVVQAPVANFTPATIQNINVGQNVTFTNTSTNNPTSFQWAITGGAVTFINGTSATSANPQVRFDAAGVYTVALTATNAGGNNTKTIADLVSVTVPLPPAPVADFTPAAARNIFVAQNITFANTSTNNPTSYQWTITGGKVTFLNSTNATSANPQVRFDEVGSYTVALTATNAGGSNTKTMANSVNVTLPPPPAPVASFTPATTQNINVGQVIAFTNTSLNSPTTFLWTISGSGGMFSFVNGTGINSANPQIRFDAAGIYTIALTVTNAGGSNTSTIANLVNVISLSVPTSLTATPLNTSSVQLKWTANNPNAKGYRIFRIEENGMNVLIAEVASKSGEFSFIDDKNLTADTRYAYRVSAYNDTQEQLSLPVEAFTYPEKPTLLSTTFDCQTGQKQIVVNGTEKTNNFYWYSAGNSNSRVNEEAKKAEGRRFLTPFENVTRNFLVTAIGRRGLESEPLLVTLPPAQKIEAAIVGNSFQSSCVGKLTLTANITNATEIVWKRGNEILDTKQTAIVVDKSGIYTVFAKNSTCEITSQPVSVEILEINKPQIEQGNNVTFCETGTLSIKTQPNVNYEWFNTENQLIGKGANVMVNASGKYFVKAKGRLGCEEISAFAEVVVNSSPIAEAIADNSVICKGEKLTLNAKEVEGATYEWKATNFSAKQRLLVLPYNENMPNEYTLYVTKNGCTTTDKITINVSKPITLSIKPSSPLCYGQANGGLAVYDLNSQNIKVSFNGQVKEGNLITFGDLKADTYEMTVINENGCQHTEKVTIREAEKLRVDAGEDMTINPWISITLNARGAKTYQWFPSEGLSDPTSANPIAKPTKTTTYRVVGKNENGCESTDEVTVTVINESAIVASKVLSPNGDGVNDTWKIENIETFPNAQIIMYNRFGQEVFTKTNYQNDWDGRIPQQADNGANGTFYYVIKVPESNMLITGTLTVINL